MVRKKQVNSENGAVLTREIPEQDRSLITVPKELRRAYPNVQPEYMLKALERCREQQRPEEETTIGWFGKVLAAVLIDETIGKRGEKHEHP